MDFDFHALSEDVEMDRIKHFKAHCLEAPDRRKAAIALSAEYLRQSVFIMATVYGGDQRKALLHTFMAPGTHPV